MHEVDVQEARSLLVDRHCYTVSRDTLVPRRGDPSRVWLVHQPNNTVLVHQPSLRGILV